MARLKDALEREARRTARGRSDETPALVHFGVVDVVALLVGLVTLAALLVWWLG